MGDDQTVVEALGDAVTGVVPHRLVAVAGEELLDHAADDVHLAAGPGDLHPAHHGLVGAVDQLLGARIDVAHGERGIGVAVHAVEEGGDIDVEDVTGLHHGGIRDSVADDLVQARAAGFLEPEVAERGRVGPVLHEHVVHHLVDVVRRHSGFGGLTGGLQRQSGDAARLPHPLDHVRRLDTGTGIRDRLVLADVLGALDARGHRATGADRAGNQGARGLLDGSTPALQS